MSTTDDARAEIDAIKAKHMSWRAVASHAGALTSRGGTLARVLGRPAYSANVADYQTASTIASAAQLRHKRHAWRAAFFGFLAAAIAGLMLFYQLTPTSSAMGVALTGVYVLFLAIAIWSAFVITVWKPYKSWASARGKAETLRIEHFKALLVAHEPARIGELPFRPLAIEYLRAYLMDDQREWFAKRAKDFQHEVNRHLRWRIAAVVMIVLATLPAFAAFMVQPATRGFVPAFMAPLLPWAEWLSVTIDGQVFALAGVIGGALQTLLTCLAATSLADRNAATYARMTEVLDALSGAPLSGARAAAVSDDALAMERFWTQLSFELIGENREWTATLGTAQLLTLDKLAELPSRKTD